MFTAQYELNLYIIFILILVFTGLRRLSTRQYLNTEKFPRFKSIANVDQYFTAIGVLTCAETPTVFI